MSDQSTLAQLNWQPIDGGAQDGRTYIVRHGSTYMRGVWHKGRWMVPTQYDGKEPMDELDHIPTHYHPRPGKFGRG